MTEFRVKPGTKRSYRRLKTPVPDIGAFTAIVRSLVYTNPLGCTSYHANLRNHPPVQKVREAHRGKVKRLPAADLFSVMLKCHDPEGELYYLNIARDRITLTSYTNDVIRQNVEAWTETVPALA